MEKLLTRWGKVLDRDAPLREYPRPQLVRDSYFNLNGIWQYAIYKKNEPFGGYEGDIVVPFSPETVLSGVEKTVMPDDVLYYKKTFTKEKTDKNTLLHFGAVDYECEVMLNGKLLGSHRGGYFPFTFDITQHLVDGENELTLKVTDPSEKGVQAKGKQTSKRGNIWYTPQSGIWQTVWTEDVPQNHITTLKLTPDTDSDSLEVEIKMSGDNTPAMISVFDGDKKLTETVSDNGYAKICLSEYELWTPENPKLYDLYIKAGEDEVKSYFGMRKFGIGKDSFGITRLMLNGKPYFHNGLLDQGYWSDGMYTAPSDEALIYDIETAKKMGYNMLRKHIKTEPLRWYYHCDRLGMIVWQDMINGGGEVNQLTAAVIPATGFMSPNKKLGNISDTEKNYRLFSREDKSGRDEYYNDAKSLIDMLYNCVSLALWTPFNEGWGQFDAAKVCEFFKSLDTTRIIDHASGWHDQGKGDVNSFHIYFTPFFLPKLNKCDDRAVALTEFGGYSMQTPGHVFNTEKFFGYRKYYKKDDLQTAIKELYCKRIIPLIRSKGLSALVYTQLSDVEDETNGLMTYDREVLKVDPEFMSEINKHIKF